MDQKKRSSYTEFLVRRCFLNGDTKGKSGRLCTSYAIIRVISVLVMRSSLYLHFGSLSGDKNLAGHGFPHTSAPTAMHTSYENKK